MTIPEAVQLVVQAGAIAERGQVYVLDMGEPVRIIDLAENMIRLSGKEPGIEIPIEVIGPAPGEKLHEVLVGDGEVVTPSPHPKIERISRPPVERRAGSTRSSPCSSASSTRATRSSSWALSRIVASRGAWRRSPCRGGEPGGVGPAPSAWGDDRRRPPVARRAARPASARVAAPVLH